MFLKFSTLTAFAAVKCQQNHACSLHSVDRNTNLARRHLQESGLRIVGQRKVLLVPGLEWARWTEVEVVNLKMVQPGCISASVD